MKTPTLRYLGRSLGAITGFLALTAFVAPDALPLNERSVWSGVYTTAQADRGREVFEASCAGCHQADLSGRGTAIPALRGESFTGSRHGQSVGDLFSVISATMPPGRAGGLSPEEYVDIVAYVLNQNAFPPGDADLAHHQDLHGIVFDEGVVAD
jgi:mono/diheme cytochrome c family protein